MSYVIRKASVPGRSARADLTTAADLAAAAAQGYDLAGDYLQWFDVDARFGKGDDRWTSDPAKALRFKTVEKAIEAWKTQSKLVPYRSDGKPNRPLTAYSITFEVAHEPEISDVLHPARPHAYRG